MAEPATPSFPLAELLGLHVATVEPGRAVARVDPSAVTANPHGVVHGAVLFAMVDTAMGAATYSVIPDGCICASIEVHLRFLRAAPTEVPLEARVRVVKAGRRVVHLDAEVDAGSDLVATATGSFAVLPTPEPA